ncbi:uncharacterized protein LOC109533526 [Dendroctonus ponderosae]|uniref:uncharacterized protein LOC109533526 n=1 Tax=Dendroctonus ponderosae TaxID=77166 RepID=UPI002035911C|nr:uncharacterized protein LOC109533526 [Dendroctonus ponderosae]
MVFDSNFADRLYDVIDYTCDESIPSDRIIFRNFVKTCDPASEIKPQETAKKNSAKAKKPEDKKKKSAKFTLQMQGEIFFTDVDPVFKLETPISKLRKTFIIPHVENLLTRFQKIYLNPLIIKVISIKNFPEEHLKDSGFTEIYCKYSIPSIADCRTIEKPLNNSIHFMESHIFPMQNLPKIKLLEFLETRRIVVEVYGEQRYQNEEDNVKARDVFLAYCSYDLSSLLKNVWDFRGKEQLHSGESRIFHTGLQELTESDSLAVDQINLAGLVSNLPPKSPLKEWVLLEKNTVLNLEAYLLSPQSAALVLHQVPNTYKGLLLIVTNKELARDWFSNISIHNQNIECGGLKPEDILTGFVIDNGNAFVLYVEGPAVGLILNLWQDLELFTPEDGKVFFNTDQTYENRLYNIGSKWTGFYVINMKIPLECIFKNPTIYIKGNTPLPCQKALIKLNLMFLTDTMKIMFQQDLFPTIDELVSLDIEYGVPYAWNQLQSSNSSETTEEIGLEQNENDLL